MLIGMIECDDAPVAAGLCRRSLLVLLLLDARRPMTVAELEAGVRRAGFTVTGRPGKVVADALRWEVARGRVRKLRRGVYIGGTVAKTTKHRMRHRVADRKSGGKGNSAAAAGRGAEKRRRM